MTTDPAEVESSEFPEFERRVDRALKQLPLPAAPPAFAAAVMRRVSLAESESPAEAPLSAFEWPVALKIALTAAGFALVAGALAVWPIVLESLRSTWQSPVILLARAAADALRPMIPAALVYVTAMCAACAAAASLLKHVALGGATHQ